MAPMKIGALLAVAMLVPIAIFNIAVEGTRSDLPVRIGRNVEVFEEGAILLLIVSTGAVAYGARRSGIGKLVLITSVQAGIGIVLAPLIVLFSRGGSLYGPTYCASSPSPEGTMHVYGTSCHFDVYLQRSWSLRMERIDTLTAALRPGDRVEGVRRKEDGSLSLLGGGQIPLDPGPCGHGLLD